MTAVPAPRPGLAAAAVLLTAGALSLPAQADVPAPASPRIAKATFAGGSFWSMEAAFDRVVGVLATTPGYTGGKMPEPSYEKVTLQQTDHVEAVQVLYDPAKVRYEQLVAYFWRRIDPTSRDGQFCDEGASFRTVIFAHDEAQMRVARASKAALQRRNPFKAPIVVKVRRAGAFHPAEEYHQDYHRKNPAAYRQYSANCGRAQGLRRLWGAAGMDGAPY